MTSVPKYELNADMMRDMTQATVEKTFGIEAQGYCCDGEMLVDVLIKAASENSSVEAACADLCEVADGIVKLLCKKKKMDKQSPQKRLC